MPFEEYIITKLDKAPGDIYILQLKPKNSSQVFDFLPGQFCQMKNPGYKNPQETHLFSIASSPLSKEYLELCIKIYGFWTQNLSQKRVGETLYISGPLGKFTWSENIKNAVFLAGGIGITPFMSMLRFILDQKLNPHITLLYGSRTRDTIAYQKELKNINKKLPNLKVIHILSHLKPEDLWTGYRGFITKEILQKEVDVISQPVFFICGPPVFVDLMKKLLKELQIEENHIRFELFT